LKSGLKNCKRMFLNAYNNLKLNGILQIVYRNKVEGNEFEKYINKIFGNFNVITQKSRIKVTICRKLE
ncbi:methyltransferase, partial [Candidatus Woesearchaeota archaeon]|nr:methyltransferase [Candidatus Woesearchaeota archaeon]